MNDIDEILCRLLWGQLQSIGLFMKKNLLIADLKTKIALPDLYSRWLDESIAVLERNNYLKRNGDSCVIKNPHPIEIAAVWNEWDQRKELWIKDPNIKARVVLVETMLRALPEILIGKVPATDIMFPNSSMELVEGIYKNNIIADYFNEALANTVVAYVQELIKQDSTVRIQMIEIGAGTGGTSVKVFQKLNSYREYIKEYCYTDVSKAFLIHAEEEYGPYYPYLTYKIFNVEAPVAGQGINAGGYDMVIAANVLHATKNIRQTLRNAKAVLKNSGLLLVNELSGNTLFTHLTFGLLEGWWLYEDQTLRIPGCPLLSPQNWQKVLESEGFQSVFFPVQEAHNLGQQIVVCKSSGVVRQKQQIKTNVAPAKQKAKTIVLKEQPPAQSRPTKQAGGITQDLLKEKSTAYFKKLLGEVLKIPSDKIDSSEPLETYGIDSILVVKMTETLGEVFDDISSTIFFEFQTIDALVEHFLQTKKDSLVALLGLGDRKLDQQISSNDEIHILPVPVQSNLSCRKSGGFLKFGNPEIKGSELQTDREPIAIIGLSGRYPMAGTLKQYWENLQAGADCIVEIPEERWPLAGFYHPDPQEALAQGKSYSKWGGFIDGFADFDPLFFNISPRETLNTDPQERLFIESCWQVLEDAGYTKEQLATQYHHRVGVFAGINKTGFDLYGPGLWEKGEKFFPRTEFGSVSNRISYLLNLQSPSMTINTMCSSSLTAIYEACEHIHRRECEMAIAGGVNINLHPSSYVYLCGQQMLSRDGECKSFGKGGNGFVPGEGVGVVLLKPLSRAIADQDHIYAVIRGASINHGGKTNGYTVPNPNAQGELIKTALERAGINARTISYIEAHGTGTELGDPIEISGLTQAFRKDTGDTQFCAIGSVKSNIGHLEAAAGIAGVTKIILQMKHQQIAPSLHAKELNPNISFAATPFIVQQELTEWKRPNINGQEIPRRAGISSFGAGGSNAHVIIEEYIESKEQSQRISINAVNPAAFGCAIIVLSAKNEERLKEYAGHLLIAIGEQQFSNANLADIAYSLQVGREAMEERLAVIAGSVKELEEKLQGFMEGRRGIDDLYRGQVKPNKEMLKVLTADQEMRETIEKWIRNGKYTQLCDLWVRGLNFDWNKLYGEIKPYRISLPTYPFAKERFWLPVEAAPFVKVKGHAPLQPPAHSFIHPLLHQNTSDFAEQRFSSTFNGQEFFLADHVVRGQRVLPGVAYLEMARVAVVQAAGVPTNSQKTGIRLKNIVWGRPIVIGEQPVKVYIGLFLEDCASQGDAFIKGEIAFEIYSESVEANVESARVVFCQGSAVLVAAAETPSLDLATVQAQCGQNTLSPDQFYEAFKAAGIDYGPAYRGIEMVYFGSEQVLAKLSLPLSIMDTQRQFVLHPNLMDSALQASMGYTLGFGDTIPSGSVTPLKPPLPCALQELEIFSNCASTMWALIRYSDGEKAGNQAQANMQSQGNLRVRKLDIDLYDVQGNACVRMKGLSSGAPEPEVGAAGSPATSRLLMFHPGFQEQAIVKGTTDLDYERAGVKHVVMLSASNKTFQEIIESQINGVHCLALESNHKSMEKRFQDYATKCFEEIQSLFKAKPAGNVLVQIVVLNYEEQQLFTGLSGLLKTARLENPKLIGQLIEIEADETAEGIIEKLKENSRSPLDNHVRYRDGKRLVTVLREIETSQEKVKVPWKDGGIYLITGGAGGLGLIFAKEIAHKVKDATLVLTGRSPLGNKTQVRDIGRELKELQELRARIEYRQVDVTQEMAVVKLMQSIQADFGGIDGIIHSAGVIQDNFIIKKTKEEFHEVLAPKVTGLVNLDQASQDLPLDFFILFSSGAGIAGNAGQADYATANAFMDAFAKYRNNLVALKKRRGQTLSINWPLWQEGGMRVDEVTEKMMIQNTGMVAMPTQTGIRALYLGLASGKDQVVVMEGNPSKMKEHLFDSALKSQPHSITESISQKDLEMLKEKTIHLLKVLFGEIAKLDIRKIDTDESLESYGIDSIIITQLNQKLAGVFGELSKTLFFEYKTLRELAEYLIADYSQLCIKWTGFTEQVKVIPKVPSPEMRYEGEFPVLTSFKAKRKVQKKFAIASTVGATEPIAIIGMSGRYPQAKTLKDYWENLKAGRDCITEIPEERWSMEGFYHPDPGEAVAQGKSYSKWGGFVEGFAEFDPLFFNISPREALNIDPQERLFLEACWEVLEDAGYTREQLSAQYNRRVGVFAGISKTGFALYGPDLHKQGAPVNPHTSFGSAANRVSYLLNLQGPSMPVDTMCSSSLTAIHEACEHLHRGECEMAMAGGVNLYLHPSNYFDLCNLHMLSSDGKCKSFGLGGDGFVPGEGVGVVLLKQLSRAITDGDHIYAVIRGTSINHGGKTNGYTVPNPLAQGELIRASLDKAGVNARTVSYIEAHGTGTALGDPIEITGLCQVFQKDTQDSGFCAIGSVKSNIGHLEAAAGIAGVTKVVLQMQHQKLVPSLHAAELNPNINFIKTPFIVQQKLTEWKRPAVEINGETKEFPRIAGISSFGAGGSNAHIVIEEYIPKDEEPPQIAITPQNPAIIVLSARDEERLKEQAQRLLARFQEQPISNTGLADGYLADGYLADGCLADVAYTLQIGREAMEERLALIVASCQELEEKLQGFLVDRDDITDLYRGQVKRNKESLADFAADEDMAKTIDAWISKGKYAKILGLWIKGLVFDWNKLYGDADAHARPRRISLPAYPFARERYWLPVVWATGRSPIQQASIHPLLQQNTSDLSEQRFTSIFTGREFFLADHVVKGQPVLPGVAYLEMARTAVEASWPSTMAAATGVFGQDLTGIRLENVVWARPIVVGEQPVKAHIGLFPQESGEIAFEVYSQSLENGTDHMYARVVHSQGNAVPGPVVKGPVLDLTSLQTQCSQSTIMPKECYEAFKSMGLQYGPGHQGIEMVYVGLGQVLAKLSLPSSVSDTREQFVLHPSLLDSALQASIGLMIGAGNDPNSNITFKPLLPFALQTLEVFGRCTSNMWVFIRYSAGSTAGDRVQKLDVDLCDVQGNVCVRMKGLSSRALEGEVGPIGSQTTRGMLMLYPGFQEQAANQEATVLDHVQHVEMLCEQKTGTAALKTPHTMEDDKAAPANIQDSFQEKTVQYFKKLLASAVNLPAHRIEAEAPLEKYGIDSIMVMKLTNQLEKTFGSLPKTLFFEYQTIKEVTGYFLENYRSQLIELTGIADKAASPVNNLQNLEVAAIMEKPASDTRRSRFISFGAGTLAEKGALDIAIIGVSGRYPQAANLSEFWKNLRDGKDCIAEIPQDRWDYRLYFDEDKNKPGKIYSKWGGFLNGVDQFDPLFFNISPQEAQILDPQERLFLECVYETLEDAGYCRESLAPRLGSETEGNVGVYVGVMYEEYQLFGAQEQIQGRLVAVSGNPASIANRVSYFYNFHGPSMAVDTMCSSSLTAIHLACQSLQRGGCEMAIAGGVNVSIHPNKYLMLSQGKFASSKGRCESFGQGGDGYVPGEGVGAALLKPLVKAVADGDHIYGIIKGTAINHGGKTNGYTVPNPNAQAEAIGQAIREAGIDPRTISYIEAHGTGTSLGDPIEIAGLTKTFERYTPDKQFCAIGSAKSNIGHGESAAGIAGVTKVLLQLKYGQLVPSLHSETLNPNIDFADTPFIVQQTLAEWKRPVVTINGQTREYPRIAGISSFGAGGSNAHVVIEEYIPKDAEPPQIAITPQHPAIIVLSAKNEERLKEQAQQLLMAIDERRFQDADLIDMAYTLQVGRDAMEERLALIVGSIEELREKLRGFPEGKDDPDVYRGQFKRNKDTLAVFATDEDMAKTIDTWISKRKYPKLIDLWVKGLNFDWNGLYGGRKPRRIGLPTYPFARERYWIPTDGNVNYSPATIMGAVIHPLLHQNISDLSEQRFSTTLTGREFFLTDHVVMGRRVLPGVAYLEMARVAVEKAVGSLRPGTLIRLKNVVWMRPVTVEDQTVEVHIGLYPEEDGGIAFEIYSEPQEPVIHSQGKAVLGPVKEIPSLDLKRLQGECSQRKIIGAEIYEAFKTMGLDYGPGHQGIEEIYLGSEQVLAKLKIPGSVLATREQYILHPGIMDSALQASIGFMMGAGYEKTLGGKPVLPFALEEVEVYGGCSPEMWVLIRRIEGSWPGEGVRRLDFDLSDGQGCLRVRIKGYASRVLESELPGPAGKLTEIGTLMLEPVWKETPITVEGTFPSYERHLVICCEQLAFPGKDLETRLNGICCLIKPQTEKSVAKQFQNYAVQIFEEIQNIFKQKLKGQALIQVVAPYQKEHQLFSGLSGLLKTAQLENPRLKAQLIEMETGEKIDEFVTKLIANSRSADEWIRYQNGKRYVAGWSEVEIPPARFSDPKESIPWKDGGIYLITGGAGGLGQIFAREIANLVKETTLILTGRSSLTLEKQTQFKELEASGAKVIYHQIDVIDKNAVTQLIQSIYEEFGGLDGIIHSAGLICDNYILKKTREEFEKVLAPKVTGLVNLDEASKILPLNFIVLFSSAAGGLGNPGQADYATANAFMDAYAKYRNDLTLAGERNGKTISINWPLWKEGGMHVDASTEKLIQQYTGLIPMRTSTGIRLLYQGMASGKAQVMVMEGNITRMKQKLAPISAPPLVQAEKTVLTPATSGTGNSAGLQEKVQIALRQMVSKLLRVKFESIDSDTELNEYGFDSISLTQFSNMINQEYKLELTPAIFFEYPTLHGFAEYLIKEHQAVFTSKFEIPPKVVASFQVLKESAEDNFSMRKHRSRFARTAALTAAKSSDIYSAEAFAIIGMTGVFPGARDVNEFWENLISGKHCITEIPKERWDWEAFYGNPNKEVNKTNIKWGGFIDGIAEFDPSFFGISKQEAGLMDPQQRLLMTHVWKVIEDAGYSAQSLSGTKTGIFIGTAGSGYSSLIAQASIPIEGYSSTGIAASLGPNRMSYFLNLHGPSEPIETACSSSLVAIHRALNAINTGDCELAIAGGINTMVTPDAHISFTKAGMLCEDGRCKAFSNLADGYVRGEGVGVLFIKKLKDAEADGDHIYGIIRGSAENHGGRANSLTAPNPKSQAELLVTAYSKAGVDPRTITYIETHGTGTKIGDPIEINGLKTAFKELYQATGDSQVQTNHCGLGSVKTNIGHLELAAGIAGVIKVLLQLKHKTLVQSLHCDTINPFIQLKDSPFYIVRETKEWQALQDAGGQEIPRRAGVSSFGFGGVNAHIVIEEYIPKNRELSKPVFTPQKPAIIVLSARNEERLKQQAQQMLAFIDKQQFSDADLADIAYTLQVGREPMEERLGLLTGSIRELKKKLKSFVEGRDGTPDLYRGQLKRNKDNWVAFSADDDLVKTIEAWINKGKFTRLVELWTKGLSFDWNKLYDDGKPKRISLPTYPFAGERYWIARNESKIEAGVNFCGKSDNSGKNGQSK